MSHMGIILIVLGAIIGPIFGFLFIAMAENRKRLSPCICQTCEYNLTGNVSGICPECGKPVPPTMPDTSKT